MKRHEIITDDDERRGRTPEAQPTVPVPRNKRGRFRFKNEDDHVTLTSPHGMVDPLRRQLFAVFASAFGSGAAFYVLRASPHSMIGPGVVLATVLAIATVLTLPRRYYAVTIDSAGLQVRPGSWTQSSGRYAVAGSDVERFSFDERANEVIVHTFDGKSRPLAPKLLGAARTSWTSEETLDLELPADFAAKVYVEGINPGPWLVAGLNRLATRFWGEAAERAARAGKTEV